MVHQSHRPQILSLHKELLTRLLSEGVHIMEGMPWVASLAIDCCGLIFPLSRQGIAGVRQGKADAQPELGAGQPQLHLRDALCRKCSGSNLASFSVKAPALMCPGRHADIRRAVL